jgi:hypothetical protein
MTAAICHSRGHFNGEWDDEIDFTLAEVRGLTDCALLIATLS